MTKNPTMFLQHLPLLLLILSTSGAALPRPRSMNKNTTTSTSPLSKDFQTLYYHQTIDHFNYQPESYWTFKQKYVINFKHWGGAKSNSPILVYLGDEAPLDDSTVDALILKDYGHQFKALLLYIEHRFYGESIPFGMSMEEVMNNASTRGYFSSAQAIADYAELILYVKEKLNAHYSPVIVIGGSYGGMLASWFRLKYPHIALGALASSAPILFFDNITSPNHGFYTVVTKDYKETSQSCYNTIKKSWVEIDKIGQKPNGLSVLSKKFKTCTLLNSTTELKVFLRHVYTFAAQYDIPSVSSLCNAIDNGSKGMDILSRIYAGIVVYSGMTSNDTTCQNINWKIVYPSDTILGWQWQTCSEMVMPMAYGTRKDSMFPSRTFDLNDYIKKCKDKYNVLPRPHWITTYYGGHDIKLILRRFGSNIIFSNGLRDPYSSAGVLENLSDSIIAVYAANGTHSMDIIEAAEDDPAWLVHQRRREVAIIDGWIRQYYADLRHDSR